MKKSIMIILLFFILLYFFISSAPTLAKNKKINFNFNDFLKTGGEYLMNYKVENMSLAEKVGQLFQVGFHSKKADSKIRDMIENYHIGGVIYFSRNIESLEQTATLSKELQDLALNSSPGLALFISADQEGGAVTRLKGATHFPGNMALGATAKPDFAQKAGKATAKELKKLGVNMNLAPVLDVNNNAQNPVIGVRSFGADAGLVARMGKAYIQGLQSQGVIATAKHFPGHGDTARDSHLDLPVIKHSLDRLEKVELYPFKKAIEAGVESIMTAHIYFPTIEPKRGIPATLSNAVLNGLLRQKMNFEGLIITDCMEMKAIVDNFGTVEGAIRTIEAGSDTVLISHSYDKQKEAIEAVIKAVKEGRISEKRIDKSVKRILRLKAEKINLAEVNKPNSQAIDFKAHQRLAENIARNSLTLVKNDNLLPIADIEAKKVTLIDFKMGRASMAEEEVGKKYLLPAYLKEKIIDFEHLSLEKNDSLSKINQKEIKKSDLIIVVTYNAVNNKNQIKIAETLAVNNRVLVIALRNPYDYQLIDKSQAFLTTYDYSPANQKAAADFILNKIKAKGKLPININ